MECDTNSDCDDDVSGNLDICLNPGTCDSECTHSTCTVACVEDSDCDDSDPSTTDYCFFRGTCNAECVYSDCLVACSADSECDDSDPLTKDQCLHAGTCEAECSNTACTVICSSDADCDDSDLKTKDTCEKPGTCLSSCAHESQELLSIEVVLDENASFSRGQQIDLNLVVKDAEGNPVDGANLSLTDSQGNEIDFNSLGNGVYSGSYTIPVDLETGMQTFSFFAASGEMVGEEQLSLEIKEGHMHVELLEPSDLKFSLNEKALIKFRLVYDTNQPVESADINASVNGQALVLTPAGSGVFTAYHLFTEADAPKAALSVAAADSLGNRGQQSFELSLEQQLPTFYIVLALAGIAVIILLVYGLKKTHRLSKLLHRRASLSLSKRKTLIQKSLAKEKEQISSLEKEISAKEAQLKGLDKDIEIERKRQAIGVGQIPSDSRRAAHKTAFIISLLPQRLRRLFKKPKKASWAGENQGVSKIDSEIKSLKERIQNLEAEFCKQNIKEDFFREKLFEYREKVHLLELEKKKLE
jgi:hypothetical protein